MDNEVLIHELKSFLDERGRLSAMPSKYKKKLAALYYLAGRIESGRVYTEAEIGMLLDELTAFHDPATLRRELYNKRLLNRTSDGSRYEKETDIPSYTEFLERFL